MLTTKCSSGSQHIIEIPFYFISFLWYLHAFLLFVCLFFVFHALYLVGCIVSYSLYKLKNKIFLIVFARTDKSCLSCRVYSFIQGIQCLSVFVFQYVLQHCDKVFACVYFQGYILYAICTCLHEFLELFCLFNCLFLFSVFFSVLQYHIFALDFSDRVYRLGDVLHGDQLCADCTCYMLQGVSD